MLINYAHRGASGYFPENTMLSFEKALEMGATGIETDVQMTKDGTLVLIHDEYVNRTTDGTGFVKDYTYKELSKLNAAANFSNKFNPCKIPTLKELIELVKDKKIILNIELKSNIIQYPNIEKKIVNAIYNHGIQNKTIVSSFNHYSLVNVKKISKKIKIGLLYIAGLYRPEKYARTIGAEALHPFFYAVNNKKIIKYIKKSKILINPYTINDEKIMEKFIDYNVNGIITNYPDKLNKILEKKKDNFI